MEDDNTLLDDPYFTFPEDPYFVPSEDPIVDLNNFVQYDGMIPSSDVFIESLYTRDIDFGNSQYTPKGMRYQTSTILKNDKTKQAVFKIEIFGYVPEFIHETDRYLDPYHDLKISCDNVRFQPGIYLSSEGVGSFISLNDLYEFELTYSYLRGMLTNQANNTFYDKGFADTLYKDLNLDPDKDSLATITIEFLKKYPRTKKLGYDLEDAKFAAERSAIIQYQMKYNAMLESNVIGMNECQIHKDGGHTIII